MDFLERMMRLGNQSQEPTPPREVPAGSRLPRPPAFRSAFDAGATVPRAVAASAASPAAAAVARPRRSVQFTDEQQSVIHDKARVVVARAFAGTGKTTTAVGYAEARPNERVLYLSFAKANQLEAKSRFPRNTTPLTAHSIAFDAVGRHFGERIDREWRAMAVRQELNLRNWREAALTQQVLRNFWNSPDSAIQGEHAESLVASHRAYPRELNAAVDNARNLWRRMCDTSDRVRIPDDAYLKMWALRRPQLPYDVVIFDEYQDANPVMASIVAAQQSARLLYLGDPHQAIYGFRGARDALEMLPGEASVHYLTQTWRFGPRIAAVANALLREFKGEKVALQGMATDGTTAEGHCLTTLARTNAQLFKIAAGERGRGVHWVGGLKKYQVQTLLDGYALSIGNTGDVKDPTLRGFASFGELQDYAEATRDSRLRIMVDLVDTHRADIPRLVADLERNEVHDPERATSILATAHAVKGLDYDHVQLAPDFEYLAEAESELAADAEATIDEQEINLLYVAATRARRTLALNDDTREWLRELPTHRGNREQARRQLEAKRAQLRFAVPPN